MQNHQSEVTPDTIFPTYSKSRQTGPKKNMAGVLSKTQNGQEWFTAAHGRKCSKHEANYPSTKGEKMGTHPKVSQIHTKHGLISIEILANPKTTN